ncbi:MAG: hypothetical protein ACI89L_000398 [Phycisphaerales bacterium]|jgi:hypothetical protein
MSSEATPFSVSSVKRFGVRSLVTLLVFGGILAYPVYRMTRKAGWSQSDAARYQVREVWRGVDNYLRESPARRDNADFRTQFEAWWGEPIVDIWGSPVEIRISTRVVVSSAGLDLEPGTQDDITYSGE